MFYLEGRKQRTSWHWDDFALRHNDVVQAITNAITILTNSDYDEVAIMTTDYKVVQVLNKADEPAERYAKIGTALMRAAEYV